MCIPFLLHIMRIKLISGEYNSALDDQKDEYGNI